MKYNNKNYKDIYVQNINMYKTYRYHQDLNYIKGGSFRGAVRAVGTVATLPLTIAGKVVTGTIGAAGTVAKVPINLASEVLRRIPGIRGYFDKRRPNDEEDIESFLLKLELYQAPIVNIILPDSNYESIDGKGPDDFLSVTERDYDYSMNIPQLFSGVIEGDILKKDQEAEAEAEAKAEASALVVFSAEDKNDSNDRINKKLYRRILFGQIYMLKSRKVLKILSNILQLLSEANKYKLDRFDHSNKLISSNLMLLTKIRQELVNLFSLTFPALTPETQEYKEIQQNNTLNKIFKALNKIIKDYLLSDKYVEYESTELNFYEEFGREFEFIVTGDVRDIFSELNSHILFNFIPELKIALNENRDIAIPKEEDDQSKSIDDRIAIKLNYLIKKIMDRLYRLVPNHYLPMANGDFKKLSEVGQKIIFYIESHLDFTKTKLRLMQRLLSLSHDEIIRSSIIWNLSL